MTSIRTTENTLVYKYQLVYNYISILLVYNCLFLLLITHFVFITGLGFLF